MNARNRQGIQPAAQPVDEPSEPPPGSDQKSAMPRRNEMVARFARESWPLLLTVIAGLTSFLTLLGLFYDRFPALRPVEPTEIRRVEITNAAIVERRSMLPDQIPAEVVFFQADAIGYDTDDIEVGTLWIDARTLQRAEPDLQQHAVWTTFTRTDRIVGWLDVTYPVRLPEASSGCLFVRVFLYPAEESAATADVDRLPFMLAYADTTPVDLFNVDGSACADAEASSPTEAARGRNPQPGEFAVYGAGR